MSKEINPAEGDIEYLHQQCKAGALPALTNNDEDWYIEKVGKFVSDGFSDKQAREMAFNQFRRKL